MASTRRAEPRNNDDIFIPSSQNSRNNSERTKRTITNEYQNGVLEDAMTCAEPRIAVLTEESRLAVADITFGRVYAGAVVLAYVLFTRFVVLASITEKARLTVARKHSVLQHDAGARVQTSVRRRTRIVVLASG